MSKTAAKTITLGILGGGQLGMFLALRARDRGLRVHLYIEGPGIHPASPYADQIIQGEGWSDQGNIKRLVDSSDVVLLENEFIPVELLQTLAPEKFFPNLAAYGIFQDKFLEKEAARRARLPVVDFALVENLQGVQAKLADWGQLVLKTCRGGYDGTGNLTVTPTTSTETIKSFLAKGRCLAERWVTFSHEVAVMVARSETEEVVFPVAETIQEQHICHQVIAPARFSTELTNDIKAQALELIRHTGGIGLFGVEFFVTDNGELLYNETAPRPHNSAHFTIEGCSMSQFDAHIRVALGEALLNPELLSPSVGMLNLLGTAGGTNVLTPAQLFEAKQGHLWLYGKKESRPGRKMGHYTLLGETNHVVLSELTELQQRYCL